MKQEQAFLIYYSVLEVKPGCQWEQIRESYRRLVQVWHPDRYEQASDELLQAEHKIKEINEAFTALSNYYKLHGKLPFSPEINVTVPRHEDFGKDQVKSKTFLRKIAISIGLAGTGYLIWNFQLGSEPYQDSTIDSIQSQQSINNPSVGQTLSSIATLESNFLDASHQEYFTYGSTLGDVYAIQGTPSRTEEGIWYYGKSKIVFKNGVVAYWESDISYPLKTQLTSDHHKLQAFAIGSSKQDVITIQGHPDQETLEVWNYGMSKVYFKNDKDIGWEDSLSNPLRTHESLNTAVR